MLGNLVFFVSDFLPVIREDLRFVKNFNLLQTLTSISAGGVHFGISPLFLMKLYDCSASCIFGYKVNTINKQSFCQFL